MIQAEINYVYINNNDFFELIKSEDKIYFDDGKSQIYKDNPHVLEFKRRVNVYYKLTVKNLRDLIPKNVKYLILQESIKTIEFELFQTCLG